MVIHVYLLVTLFIVTFVTVKGQKTEFTNKIFLEADDKDWAFIENGLSKVNLHFKEKIFPSLYVVEYRGLSPYRIGQKRLKKIQTTFNGKIQAIEQVLIHFDHLRRDPEPVSAVSFLEGYNIHENAFSSRQPHFDMSVEDAWALNYTGKNVVIAVTDVGVNTHIEDLKANIAKDLSINLSDNGQLQSDVTPESHMSYRDIPLPDHGNRCAGLIAAINGNGICSTGIAYNATIAVIKIFKVKENMFHVSYSGDALVKGLSHRLQDIHIFSNSWVFNRNFLSLNMAEKKVLKHGIETGRYGKGTIYVFPAGPVAEGFANSIFTIAISSVGVNGSKPAFASLSAAVLVSTYGEGHNYRATDMLTTSRNAMQCTNEFKGTSASTAFISATIGLALEANPSLSWRDVQHLLVQSAEKDLLQERNYFNRNAAGYYYHNTFGYGLLNALKLINLAKDWKGVPGQRKYVQESTKIGNRYYKRKKHISEAIVFVSCKGNPSCITKLETVVIDTTFVSTRENELEIAVRSPSGTVSILMDMGQSHLSAAKTRKNVTFKSVHFWGESSQGTWTLILAQRHIAKERFGILSFSLEMYGTTNQTCYQTNDNDPSNQCTPRTHTRPTPVTTASSSTHKSRNNKDGYERHTTQRPNSSNREYVNVRLIFSLLYLCMSYIFL